MKSERIDHIRHEEKLYHDYCYNNYKLFERGSLETAKKGVPIEESI